MTTAHRKDLGIIQFMPIESFFDFSQRFDREVLVERLIQDLSEDAPLKPLNVGDWPHVHEAVQRRGLFIIETETPSFTAMLRFNPDQPDAGDYTIHHSPRGGVESGRITEVVALAADDTDTRISMLAPFPTRYRVATVGSARPRERRMWLVGLRDFKIVDESDDADEAVI